MIKTKFVKFLILIVSPLILGTSITSCGKKEFKVKGEIEGASKETVELQKADFNGRWLTLDSTKTSSSGSFSFRRPSLQAPEIFRLRYGNNYIYLPVDSTETIEVKTSASGFGKNYTLQGSDNAIVMAQFDAALNNLPSNIVPDSLNDFKKEVYTKYIQPNPATIVSYYILTKETGGEPLFSPSRNEDYKYFAAVATAFRDLLPDDPRTTLLTQTSLEAMKKKNSEKGIYRQFEAQEVSLIDIELPDEKGEIRKLSDIAGKGNPVVVVFNIMTGEDSPAINYELSQIKNRIPGLEIYQVSLDPDRYAWRDAAVNLPWITVFDSDGEYSRYASAYNLDMLPSFFIYNSNGELQERVNHIEELKKKL